jgi:hexosaminidase
MTLSIIPAPKSLASREGHFILNAQTPLVVAPGAEAVAQHARDWLRKVVGGDGVGDGRGIHLELLPDLPLNDEGYRLDVTQERIAIQARAAAGLFYGLQTLRQLLPPDAESAPSVERAIPVLHIEDEPRFGWRGLMLDVCRHFFPLDVVRRMIDVMALYKYNVLHFHLTDDQGWRIEIKRYPRLTEVGAWRPSSPLHERPPEGEYMIYAQDGVPYGGYYTQDELKALIAYAAERFITIVPEIEMPGHSVAALAAYPELGCIGEGYKVRTLWGIEDDVLCAGKEETYVYVEDVLREVVALFPSLFIHIGGDECPKVRWHECPRCQAVIAREGLKDEHELQSYFVRRVEGIVQSLGRRLVGWDEVLEGGLAPNATVMSWRGAAGGIEAANAGHDVVMTPNTHCYFDYAQSADILSEPLAATYAGPLPLEGVYAFNPTDGIPADKHAHVLGGQGNIWTEFIRDEAHLHYMTFPRALALAECVWSPLPRADFTDFRARLDAHLARLASMDVNFRAAK